MFVVYEYFTFLHKRRTLGNSGQIYFKITYLHFEFTING